jgi:hypothetical protein
MATSFPSGYSDSCINRLTTKKGHDESIPLLLSPQLSHTNVQLHLPSDILHHTSFKYVRIWNRFHLSLFSFQTKFFEIFLSLQRNFFEIFFLYKETICIFAKSVVNMEPSRKLNDCWWYYHSQHPIRLTIADLPDSYVVADDIEIGYGHKIPLWIFGLIYWQFSYILHLKSAFSPLTSAKKIYGTPKKFGGSSA